MRLGEELARILPVRRPKRRPAEEAPREIVPSDDPFEAARERLKATIAPPAEEDDA